MVVDVYTNGFSTGKIKHLAESLGLEWPPAFSLDLISQI